MKPFKTINEARWFYKLRREGLSKLMARVLAPWYARTEAP